METFLLIVLVFGIASILVTAVRLERTIESVSMLASMTGLLAFLAAEYVRRTSIADSWIDVLLPMAVGPLAIAAVLWFVKPDVPGLDRAETSEDGW